MEDDLNIVKKQKTNCYVMFQRLSDCWQMKYLLKLNMHTYNFVTKKNRLIGLREVVYPIPFSQ